VTNIDFNRTLNIHGYLWTPFIFRYSSSTQNLPFLLEVLSVLPEEVSSVDKMFIIYMYVKPIIIGLK